jgi:hypothetical protein
VRLVDRVRTLQVIEPRLLYEPSETFKR